MPVESLMKGRIQQRDVDRPKDGTERIERLLRDGSYIAADWLVAMALEGRIFQVNFGQGTTYVTAKTALTAAQPDLNLDVPQGVVVIPLAFHLTIGALAGTANHFFLQAGQGNVVGNGTSSAATGGPFSVFQGQGPIPTGCTARQAYSGNGTAPGSASGGSLNEFVSWDQIAANGAGSSNVYDWNINFVLPTIITGPGSISGYGVSTTTALQFKAILTYLELPASAVQ